MDSVDGGSFDDVDTKDEANSLGESEEDLQKLQKRDLPERKRRH